MRNPPANVDWILARVDQLYGIKVVKVIKLNSYNDTNFYIKTTETEELIVKITNDVHSSEHGLLEATNDTIFHLFNNGINVTLPIVNKEGTYLTFEQIPAPDLKLNNDSPKYGFRILKYIPGKILLDVAFTPAILRECGEVLAKMSMVLEMYSNPVLKNRKYLWSLLNIFDIKQYMDAVDSRSDREIVMIALDQFETQMLNNQDQLEFQIIHGDYNEQNIIVEPIPNQTIDGEDYRVKGVIDFNDMHWAPRVFDLAIYLAYSMLGQFTVGPQILIPGFGLSGYLKYKSLTQNELNVLYYCIKARLCQSLVMGAHYHRLNPNNIYLLSSAKKGWPALRALHNCEPNDILNKWLNVDKQLFE